MHVTQNSKFLQTWAGYFAIFTLWHSDFMWNQIGQFSGRQKLQFWWFWTCWPWILIFERIPNFKVLKILKFLRWDTQILREIKFGNLRRSKTAILVILESLNSNFWENSTFESVRDYNKMPKFWPSENYKLASPGLYLATLTTEEKRTID